MTANPKQMLGQAAPWRPGISWQILGLEGIAALALGLFILWWPQQAGAVTVQALGAFLAFTSILEIVRVIRHRTEVGTEPGRWIRVGIGLVVGLVAFAFPWISTVPASAAATFLAIGLLLSGGVGVYGVIKTRAAAGMRWGRLLLDTGYIVLGVVLLLGPVTGWSTTIFQLLGYLALLAGVALLIFAFVVYRKVKAAVAQAAAESAVLQTRPDETPGPDTARSSGAENAEPTDVASSASGNDSQSAAPATSENDQNPA